MAKKYKAFIIDWQALADFDDTEILKVCLTQRQVAILKACLSPQYWSTRWQNQTVAWDVIQAYVAGIDAKLDGQECEVMTFCEDVANCIGSSEAVADALTVYNTINYATGGVGDPENVLPEALRQEDLLPEGFTCDNDHRYGTAVGIVVAIHDATLEVLQKIEILTNPFELAAEIADNVPIAEAAGIAAEIILWVQDTAVESYVAAWSDTVKDEISCEIFCLLQDEWPCHLDYEMLMDVYKDEDFPFPPAITDSWLVWAEWLILLPFTDDRLIVKLVGMLGLLTMRYGGKFGKFILGVRSLKTTIALLADDTDPDWETLCLECPERWEHEWNFVTHGMEAWTIDSDYGEYQIGVGVAAEREDFSGDWKVNVIRYLALNEEIPRCDRFQIHCEIVRGTWDASPFPAIILQNPPEDENDWNSGHITTGTKSFTSSFSLSNLEYVRVGQAVSDYTEGPITGSFIITGVTLKGQGSDPFEERITS